MTKAIVYIGSLSLIFLMACIDPFVPDVGEYEDALTVTGSLLEGKVVSTIRLGRTFALQEEEGPKVGNAKVEIVDDNGNRYPLRERAEGIYVTDTTELVPQKGSSYQLYINTDDGNEYESDFQEMESSSQIDQLYAEFQERVRGFDTLSGMQVFLDATDVEDKAKFFRWEFEETWHVQVPFPSRGDWDAQNNTFTYYEGDSIPVICYAQNFSSEILLENTRGLSQNRVTRYPIHFVSTETNRLWRRYSILVKQYSVSEETYSFWEAAEQINENLGTLFDPIPNQLLGNIRNINDPDEPVLGYFSADGYDERRIFIDNLDLPDDIFVANGNEFCILDFFFTAQELSIFVAGGGSFVGVVTDFFGNIVGYTGSIKSCADCRTQGRLAKPDFWR
ncbi:MAG: DUF4249 domain-containing protein [Bacteroidota bacterium]